MKQNIYLFSNSILRRKNNTLLFETSSLSEPSHSADITGDEIENLVTPSSTGTGETKKYMPAENVEAIYTFGSVNFNSQFLAFASKHFIPVHVFNYYGGYVGSFMPKTEISSGNIVLLQSEHYSDPQKQIAIAKQFVKGAALNALSNMTYYLYRNAPLEEDISMVKKLASQIENVNTTSELMGIEGSIKAAYYKSWQKIFRGEVEFDKRVRRPPDNMVNSLLSFGNVMLYSVCLNEIYRTGLLPSIGFLHAPGDNRFPLSFDVSEVFKPVIVDKTIFRVINTKMISEDGFDRKGGLMYMKDKIKKTFVEAIEDRLKTTFLHPVIKRNVSYKTLIRLECYNLIKHLKGTEEYKPFISES